jgi:hypothetical protein
VKRANFQMRGLQVQGRTERLAMPSGTKLFDLFLVASAIVILTLVFLR